MKQKELFLAGEGDAWFRRNRGPRHDPPGKLECLRKYLGTSSSVLEIGCGDGHNLALLRQWTGCRVTGVDPSAEAVQAARVALPEGQFHHATADALEGVADEFDLVLFGFCLYLVDRPLLPRVVCEADRRLKNGGILAIMDFDAKYPRERNYRHHPGAKSYKEDHAQIFLGFPFYSLLEKASWSHAAGSGTPPEAERCATTLLLKDYGHSRIVEHEG